MDRLVQAGPLTLLVAAVVGVLGVARFTRLWVHDAWPPVQWLRGKFLDWCEQTRPKGTNRTRDLTWRYGWTPLATCPFCVAPWFALISLGWFVASDAGDLHGSTWGWGAWWWLAHLWFAASYGAAMVVVRDEPPEED